MNQEPTVRQVPTVEQVPATRPALVRSLFQARAHSSAVEQRPTKNNSLRAGFLIKPSAVEQGPQLMLARTYVKWVCLACLYLRQVGPVSMPLLTSSGSS